MHKRYLNPLTLAIALACAGSAFAIEPLRGLDVKGIDAKAPICGNLNDHVNGQWAKSVQIPADRTTWGSFEILDELSQERTHKLAEDAAANLDKAVPGSIEQKIGAYYRSGMDEAAIEKAGIAPLADELKRIDALKKPADIVAYIGARHAAGLPVLFNFGAVPDFNDSTINVAGTRQGGLGLPERGYYLEDGKDGANRKTRDAYVAHVAKMLELAGAKPADAAQQAKDILALETRLATASFSRIEMRNPENQYHWTTLAESAKVTPHFGWEQFFAAQHADVKSGFSLAQPKFFGELDKALGDVPMATWHAYLRFHTLRGAAPYLSNAFAVENFNFYGKTLRGQQEMQPRWKRVLGSVEDDMGMALGQLYVKQYFPPEAKQRADELVQNLRLALKARIEKLEWMSPETKKLAMEKWASFMPKIGYPDEWRDWTGLNIKPGDSYFANAVAAAKFNNDWDIGKIGKAVDRKEWGMSPQTVNAYYNPQQNEIVFPAAILQPPFFDAKADDALNYGGIGTVIGHEMFHGYDDQGSQFDAKGNFKNWWTDADKQKFQERTARLVKQFDDYVAIDGLHVKGQLTLGENIADLGGLTVAWDALQAAMAKNPDAKKKIDGYTQDQRFFLNFAQVWRRAFRDEELKLRLNTDPHAPAFFRAIGAPSNLPVFAQAFSCKANDGMVRGADKQVTIW